MPKAVKNLGKDYSVYQEVEIARYLGGRVQPNSGGTKFGGGDIHTKSFLIEAKTPTKSQSSFAIKKEWVDKMKDQAFEQGKIYSALAFRFNPEGPDFFVVDRQLMGLLVQFLEEENK